MTARVLAYSHACACTSQDFFHSVFCFVFAIRCYVYCFTLYWPLFSCSSFFSTLLVFSRSFVHSTVRSKFVYVSHFEFIYFGFELVETTKTASRTYTRRTIVTRVEDNKDEDDGNNNNSNNYDDSSGSGSNSHGVIQNNQFNIFEAI